MKATIRKATVMVPREHQIIPNHYDTPTHVTIIQDYVPNEHNKDLVLCMNKDKLVQIVHMDDLMLRFDMFEEVDVNEDVIDYDLGLIGFIWKYSKDKGVYIDEKYSHKN